MKIILILKKIKHFIIRPKKPIIIRKINGQNNTITFNSNSLSNVIFDICGDNNTILIPDSCKISNTKFFIQGNNNLIKLGENICINGGSLWQEDNFTSIVIGNKTTFENIHLAATENYSKIIIGNDCMFAYDIEVRTGDSHSIIDKNTKTRLNKAANVVIGNHVWVTAHCELLKGISIADNCVVATGSIVTKSFESPNCIIGGNPAKILKKDINWIRERI